MAKDYQLGIFINIYILKTTYRRKRECVRTLHNKQHQNYSWVSAFRYSAFQSGAGAFQYRTRFPYSGTGHNLAKRTVRR